MVLVSSNWKALHMDGYTIAFFDHAISISSRLLTTADPASIAQMSSFVNNMACSDSAISFRGTTLPCGVAQQVRGLTVPARCSDHIRLLGRLSLRSPFTWRAKQSICSDGHDGIAEVLVVAGKVLIVVHLDVDGKADVLRDLHPLLFKTRASEHHRPEPNRAETMNTNTYDFS